MGNFIYGLVEELKADDGLRNYRRNKLGGVFQTFVDRVKEDDIPEELAKVFTSLDIEMLIDLALGFVDDGFYQVLGEEFLTEENKKILRHEDAMTQMLLALQWIKKVRDGLYVDAKILNETSPFLTIVAMSVELRYDMPKYEKDVVRKASDEDNNSLANLNRYILHNFNVTENTFFQLINGEWEERVSNDARDYVTIHEKRYRLRQVAYFLNNLEWPIEILSLDENVGNFHKDNLMSVRATAL